MKKKKLSIVLLLVIFSVLALVIYIIMPPKNFDFKYPPQVSKSIEESKEKKVFIAKYQITDIKMYDSSLKFPIRQAWLEKGWGLTLDKNRDITYKVDNDSIKGAELVFDLNKDTLFNEEKFDYGRWQITDSGHNALAGDICGGIAMQVEKNNSDSLVIVINKQHASNEININLTKIAEFKLKRE